MPSDYALNAETKLRGNRNPMCMAAISILHEKYGVKCATDGFKVGEIKMSFRGEEIQTAEFFNLYERFITDEFDDILANAVKDIVYRIEVEEYKSKLNEIIDKISEVEEDVAIAVSRSISEMLGPNSNWVESKGTC